MYKLLLCWRYLRTRYLAMLCIVSVMLGVATLIVVNSVMSGFSTKLRERLHGLLSDVVIESHDIAGFGGYEEKMAKIRKDPFLNQQIEHMAPTLEIFAMLQFNYAGRPVNRTVRMIGIDPKQRAALGGFKEHLVRQKDSDNPQFKLDAEGQKRYDRLHLPVFDPPDVPKIDFGPDGEIPPPNNEDLGDPFAEFKPQCAILGYAIAHYRDPSTKENGKSVDRVLLPPGTDVILTTVNGVTAKPRPVYDRFTVCDYIKTEMSEYDSQYVYVPLKHMQKLRAMEGRVTSIQIKLKDEAESKKVVEKLHDMFASEHLSIQTWDEKQGPLLAAIAIEKKVLNVLLFLIIAVAGFGILAIFSMIVMEKTRDIGVLKALGASNGGVMKIFIGYGLLLGLVGAALGTGLGLVITNNVNQIESAIASWTGSEIFDRNIYYFQEIPTHIEASMIIWVNLGSILIAMLFSVLPALRAAMLHPVRALRFE